MTVDKLGREIQVGDKMIFSAGKEVAIYEVLKIRERRIQSQNELYVNVGSSKKWKQARDGILFRD